MADLTAEQAREGRYALKELEVHRFGPESKFGPIIPYTHALEEQLREAMAFAEQTDAQLDKTEWYVASKALLGTGGDDGR